MATYHRTEEIQGKKPFRCLNCGLKLVTHIQGKYKLEVRCRRCKASITINTEDEIPQAATPGGNGPNPD